MKYLAALAAGLAALNTFLLSTPGVHVAQYVFIAVGGANVVVAAMVAILSKLSTPDTASVGK